MHDKHQVWSFRSTVDKPTTETETVDSSETVETSSATVETSGTVDTSVFSNFVLYGFDFDFVLFDFDFD